MTGLGFHVDQLFYPTPGGIGTYVRELVPALARSDPPFDIVLFHARFGAAAPEPWMERFRSIELTSGIKRLYPQWALLGRPLLPPEVASLDLLHAPSPSAVPPAGPRQRLVVTVHDLAFLIHPHFFAARWRLMFRAGLARAARSADALITPSRHTAGDLVRRMHVDPKRVHVVPLAASLPRPGSDVAGTLERLGVEPPYVLFVGNLEPRKNLVRLVRAYRRAASRGAPHALVLAGPLGWRHQEVVRAASMAGPGKVILPGRVEPSDLDALYEGAAVFAYPSAYEGFGLPVLEAMSRGVPCIVSSSSSLPEVAGDAALTVDPRSLPAIAEALERLMSDKDLASRLGERGRARAARFSWEETARRTRAVYDALLD